MAKIISKDVISLIVIVAFLNEGHTTKEAALKWGLAQKTIQMSLWRAGYRPVTTWCKVK